ncbi:hypothetical protein MRX96_047289 [Rhipicephalus microplus]
MTVNVLEELLDHIESNRQRRILNLSLRLKTWDGFRGSELWLRKWPSRTQKIGPWLLCRFGASALHADSKTLLVNLARAMGSAARPVYVGVAEKCGTYNACMIADCWDPTNRNWTFVFVALWSGQQFTAVYAGTDKQQRAVTTGLQISLGEESVELLRGIHNDLDSVYSAGIRDIGSSTFHPLDRNPSVAARFFPNGQPREQAADQP